MNRAVALFVLFAVCLAARADTFNDIMEAHHQAVSKLSLSKSTKQAVVDLDQKFEKSMRADLEELVSLEKASPRRGLLVAKMKKDNSAYKQSLSTALGAKWDAYQRAYGALVPSTKRNTSRVAGTSKSKKKAENPSGHKKGK